jgi:RNA polymerase sigma-70 factor (ECF subfamily)
VRGGTNLALQHGMSQSMLSAHETDSDAFLLTSAVAGDEVALRELMRRHSAPLRARALHLLDDPHLADEVVQDVFIVMMKRGGEFRRDSSLGTWLYVIATNRCLNVRRLHARRAVRHAPPIDASFADSAPSPHDAAEMRDRRERLARAVAALPRRLREVASLRIAGHSYPEIAARQGCTRGTVASYLHRELKRIETDLRANGVTPETI